MKIDTYDGELGDDFQYFILLDVETTGWDQKRRMGSILSPPEIIEISAMVVDAFRRVEGEFHQYVLPTEFPTLTEKCMKKTGVTQENVDAGLPLADAIDRFNDWLKIRRDCGPFIMKPEDSDLDLEFPMGAFVTWTDWPLGVCLEDECLRKGILKPVHFDYWINLKLIYKSCYPHENPHTLKNVLFLRDLDTEDPDIQFTDSMTFAWLIDRMLLDGAIFSITSYFVEKHLVTDTSLVVQEEPEEGQSPGASNESEE